MDSVSKDQSEYYLVGVMDGKWWKEMDKGINQDGQFWINWNQSLFQHDKQYPILIEYLKQHSSIEVFLYYSKPLKDKGEFMGKITVSEVRINRSAEFFLQTKAIKFERLESGQVELKTLRKIHTNEFITPQHLRKVIQLVEFQEPEPMGYWWDRFLGLAESYLKAFSNSTSFNDILYNYTEFQTNLFRLWKYQVYNHQISPTVINNYNKLNYTSRKVLIEQDKANLRRHLYKLVKSYGKYNQHIVKYISAIENEIQNYLDSFEQRLEQLDIELQKARPDKGIKWDLLQLIEDGKNIYTTINVANSYISNLYLINPGELENMQRYKDIFQPFLIQELITDRNHINTQKQQTYPKIYWEKFEFRKIDERWNQEFEKRRAQLENLDFIYQQEEHMIRLLQKFDPGFQIPLLRMSELMKINNSLAEKTLKFILDTNPKLGVYNDLAQMFQPSSKLGQLIDDLIRKYDDEDSLKKTDVNGNSH